MKPLVSIIIPVFNGSDYLEHAINSALDQTYDNIEVIVVNDGSTDGGATEKLARSYEPDITYYYKPNGGVSSALNLGVEKSRGSYITWLSHDDVILPNKIERQIEILSKFDRPVVVYGEATYINERGEKIGSMVLPDTEPSQFFSHLICGWVFERPWRPKVFVANGCTMIFPKEAFETVGPFDEDRKVTQDYKMLMLVNQHYDFILVHEIFLLSRRHEKAGTVVMSKRINEEAESLMDFALSLYDPRSAKFNLDLGKALLAFSLIPSKHKAYQKLMLKFWGERRRFEDTVYVSLSIIANSKIVKGLVKKLGV